MVAVAAVILMRFRKDAQAAMNGTANTTGAPAGATDQGALAALSAGSGQALPPPDPIKLTTIVSRAQQTAAGNITLYTATDSAADQAAALQAAQIRQAAAVKILNDPAKAARLAAEVGKKCQVSGRRGVRVLNSTGTDTWCDTKAQLPPVATGTSAPSNIVNPAAPTGGA